jgi:hypothetical protein
MALGMIACMTGWEFITNGPIPLFEKASRGEMVDGSRGESTITTLSMVSEETLLSLYCLPQKNTLIDAL